MRKLLLVFLATLSALAGLSQSHNIKLNATSLIGWRVGEIQYEYRLNDKIGLQLGVGGMIPRGTRFLDRFDPSSQLEDGETNIFANLRMTGYRITPEVKLYLGDDADNPTGFYLAPFLRHYNYSLTSEYSQFVDGNLESIGLKVSSPTFGAGLGIGSQWLISDKFTIDVMWLGFGLSGGGIKARFESSFETEDWDEVETEWLEELEQSEFGFLNRANLTRDANGITITTRNPVSVILRSSLSIGYFF